MIFDEKSKQVGRLLLILDSAVTALAFIFAFWVREYLITDNPANYYEHLALLVLLLPVQALVFWYRGAYRGLRIFPFHRYMWIVTQAIAVSFASLFAILFLLKAEYVSRAFLGLFGIINFIALVTTRSGLVWWYFRRSIEKDENFLKVVVIGTGERAQRLVRVLRNQTEWGVHVVGYLDFDAESVGKTILDAPVLGQMDQIAEVLKQHVVDEVIVAIPRTKIANVQEIADACETEGVRLRLMADVFDVQVTRMQLSQLGNIPLLSFEPVAQNELKLIVKRMFDLIVTFAFLPIFAPLMILIAIAIKLDSPGPVFFIQPRVGLRKRVFPMYKFRSMCIDAEQRLEEISHLNEAQGPIFKITNDPRVTRVGRFIRRTSLDELPQLINVIRGHMSLVGPRPMSLRDVDLFDKGIQRKRFSVRPGLTCLWQVSGRSNLPFSKWLELDLQYIENWSLLMDIKILIRTIPAVLRGSGAV